MRRICINQKCKSENVSFLQNTVSGSYYQCQVCGRTKDKSEWELVDFLQRVVLAVQRQVMSAGEGIDRIQTYLAK